MTDAPWRVELTRTAQRDLRRLDPPIRRRVHEALLALAEDPRQATTLRKLTGAPEWRLRVGDWRALVLLDDQARTIQVTRVLPRGRAYRNWTMSSNAYAVKDHRPPPTTQAPGTTYREVGSLGDARALVLVRRLTSTSPASMVSGESMSAVSSRQIDGAILAAGTADYLDLWFITQIVEDELVTEARGQVLEETLQAVSRLLRNGQLRTGGLVPPGEFVASDEDAQAAYDRIEAELRALDRDLRVGEIAWFEVPE